VDGIQILRGLAQHHFESVLAHEFGHVWLFVHRLEPRATWQAEGFCQLLAYLWLESLGTPEATHLQARIQNMRDSVYGDGFREIHGAWMRGGLDQVRMKLGIVEEKASPRRGGINRLSDREGQATGGLRNEHF
jgi:hypothetical protein